MKGHERSMVNRTTLGAALIGARRFDEAIRELNDTLQRNRSEWNANFDLMWSAMHLLVRALEVQGKYEQAVSTAREAMKFTSTSSRQEMHVRVLKAIAARDFASAVSHWKKADTD